MAVCPICERAFDEREYQLVIRDVGAFDSFACAEEALRRHRRRSSGELPTDLLDAARDTDRASHARFAFPAADDAGSLSD